MGIWTDRVKNHPVWSQLEAIGPDIDRAINGEDSTNDNREGVARLKAIFSFVGRRLAATDTFLIDVDRLDEMEEAVSNAHTGIVSFNEEGDGNSIVEANNQADICLLALSKLPNPAAVEELQGLREVTDTYRSTLDKAARDMTSSAATVEAKFIKLSDELDKLGSEFDAEKQRLLNLTTEHQAQFSNAQEARLNEYNEARQTQFEDFRELTQLSEQQIHNLEVDFKDRGEKIITSMSEQLAKAEALTGVTANHAVTHGYQKDANEARFAKFVWQGFAAAALAFLVWIGYSHFLPLALERTATVALATPTPNAQPVQPAQLAREAQSSQSTASAAANAGYNWAAFAARVFVSLTVCLFAGYAIRQADRNQRIERQSRKLALELEALGPFVQQLAVERQQDFRLKVGERAFHSVDTSSEDSKEPKTDEPTPHFAHWGELRKLLVEVLKAAKEKG